MEYTFVKTFDKVTDQSIESLCNNSVGVVIVDNAKEEDIDRFGNIIPQDLYGSEVVPIGTLDKTEQHVHSTPEMLWHSDRSYSKDVHPIVGLFCIAADQGSSPTYFCDMQLAYKNASEELKNKTEGVSCQHSIAKYSDQIGYPHDFKDKRWERLHRLKGRTKHDLVCEDSYGKYFFYSEGYTETSFEDELKDVCYQNKNIYKHVWRPNQLVVYNNYKVTHKRDETPTHVDRRHLRFAVEHF